MAQQTDVTRANGTRAHDLASVSIRIPADSGYVVLVQAAAGHLAAQLGYGVPEVTNLRLAVDEACRVLLSARGPQTTDPGTRGPHRGSERAAYLECRFSVRDDGGLRCRVSGPIAAVTEPDT